MTSEPYFDVGQKVQRNNRPQLKSNRCNYREGVVLERWFGPVNKFRPGVNEYWHYKVKWDDKAQPDTYLQQRLLPLNEKLTSLSTQLQENH